ncbi:hypothetical protein BWQ96_04487 [Gracilariopsis chorda]|uniref:MYND-type domain-containing protein n=1 Tax=Gracilariopsis chorda TaxID=448386 RepID=A0A2V3IUG2_9FLOR|nr:hypothetical protein BWQ96_04487 [Gracilariopsis chorda]|eukprot:PXF45719.1 hypothetical protein BWQ96_04487 [Gracilariopsis chorda]
MPPIALSSRNSSLIKRAHKLPPPNAKLAYQIVAAQLRVWTADHTGRACRPWYIFCLELYPRGTVINQTIMRPASQPPSPTDMLSFLLSHIVDPPKNQPVALPTQVSFIDQSVTEALAPHLRRLNIEVATLTLADGLSDYVKRFSDKMISDDRATRSDTSERPGLLSVPHVSASLISKLTTAACKMYAAQPWRNIAEHLALRVLLPADSEKRRQRFFLTVLGSDEKIMGFALMPSLHDLRSKYRRAVLHRTDGLEDDGEQGRIAPDVLVCASCGRRVEEQLAEDGRRFVHRCAACKRLLYCDETCQRRDWAQRHRSECETAAADAEYVFRRDEWGWLKRELVCLFVDPTSVPFDDLDGFELFKWPFVREQSPPLYPLTFASVQGFTTRVALPTKKEIEVMIDIARTLTECVRPPPKDGVIHLASGVSISVAENLADSLP